MIWINGCPQFLIDVPLSEEIIQIIDIPHTPLLSILTRTSVFIFNQFTLLPITSHVRSSTSIETNGYNLRVKIKHVSVNAAKSQKLNLVNLFIQTESNFLIIYQCTINYNRSLYEVHNNNDELIQSGLPLSFTSEKFSLVNFIKSATKSIIHGTEELLVNLENIENINNSSLEDELGNYTIDYVKLSIFQILKIGIGLERYWLEQNSHTLIIFNNKDENHPDVKDDYFQLVNIRSFKNELYQLSEFSWYEHHKDSMIVYINYNSFFNYFIFLNEKHELWYMSIGHDSDGEMVTNGHKLQAVIPITDAKTFQIWFNPGSNLFLVRQDSVLKLFKFENQLIEFLKDMDTNLPEEIGLTWSSCGKFFIVVDKSTGHWKLVSKFGNATFKSEDILHEIDENVEENKMFLTASTIVISGNGMNLYILSEDKTKLFYVNLLSGVNDSQRCLLYDNEYLSIIQNNKNIIRYPILPKFKKILQNQEHFNGHFNKSIKSQIGKFSLARSDFNQISISYGDHLAISTPYCSGDNKVNHILWFNFKSYFADSMNIINHFWFKDYLLVVNRRSKHVFTEVEEENLESNGTDHLVDEFIVFDTTGTRYGVGGEDISFNSDSLLWKYDFKSTFLDIQIMNNDDEPVAYIVILTSDYRLIVLELDTEKVAKSSKTGESKHYKIYISVKKTVHLSSIKHKLPLDDVSQISVLNNRHFLFLLKTGDFYLLKNQTGRSGSVISNSSGHSGKSTNMYDLIKINSTIEYFKFKSIKFNESSYLEFIYLFNGENILIYEVDQLLQNARSTAIGNKLIANNIDPHDLLSDEDLQELQPIIIDSDGIQPLKFDIILDSDNSYKSLDLIGLENLTISKANVGGLIIKNKISHKLILNNFIEFDLLNKGDLESSFNKYRQFKNFHYCLELLLFKYLTISDESLTLKRLCQLIEFTENSEYIYINCLRKIEVNYWNKFFDVLETSPAKFMKRLIDIDNVELCYNYLIIYLNFKREGEEDEEAYDERKDQLSADDKEVILKIMKMLDKSGKWDWCFELCRFIKLLEPSGQFLGQIKVELK